MRVQGYRRGALRSFVLHLLVFSAFIGIFLSPFHAEGADTATLIVKLHDTLSVEEQAQLFARDGGEKTSSVPALRLHIVRVPAADLPLILQNYQNDPQVVSVEVGKSRRAEGFSNDSESGAQWALGKIGWDQLFGAVTPAGTARIALLDTGVNANHPDLIGAAVPGASMLVSGENGMTDPNGHGTALAGIIAAVADNNLGVAGVAYHGVSVMPVTVLDASGIGQDSDIVAGIVWAADHGADVILMGFSNQEYSPSLQDAIDYAWSKGAVLVAATGNGGLTAPTYPAGCRGVIGVSATDQGDLLAAGSNYGVSAFLAAPGTNIFTTGLSGSYSDLNGTSASSAIVAAVAGFMKASDPSLGNGVIVGRMARTADAAGAPDDPENQAKFGNGRVNMARAVADTSTEAIQPAGAAPPASGGPYAGPYVAASQVDAVIIGSQQGTLTYGRGGSVTYDVTVTSKDLKGKFTTHLEVTGLPEGVIGTFSRNDFSGFSPQTSKLTLATDPFVAAGTHKFTVTANSKADSEVATTPKVTATGALTITTATGPGPLDHFAVTVDDTVKIAGAPFAVTVTARDAVNNIIEDFTDTANLTTTAGTISPLVSGMFQKGTWTGYVTVTRAGTASVTVTDPTTGKTGSSGDFEVIPGPAAAFSVSAPAGAVAGEAVTVTVTAKDLNDNVASGYVGTVRLTTKFPGATLPAVLNFQASDGGSQTFQVTFVAAGVETVDVSDGRINGFSNSIEVSPANPTQLLIIGPSSVVAGSLFEVTVTVKDAHGNTVTDYFGTVHFVSDDPNSLSTLPVDYTFVPDDKGTHTFSEVTLRTSGTRTVGAADTSSPAIAGRSGSIQLSAGTATQVSIETEADGSGVTVEAQSVTAGNSVTGYAVARDQFLNYIANVAAVWSLEAPTELVAGSDLVPAQDGKRAIFTGHGVGSATIAATSAGMEGRTGPISVTPAALHRFDLSTISSPLTLGASVPLSITAKDAYGNLANDFNADVDLAISAGSTVSPGTVTFNNGSWSGAVTVTGAGTDRVVTARSGEAEGTSNSFNIVKTIQTIVMGTLGAKTFGDPPFVVMAQGGGSGNSVTFTAGPDTVCTISGATVAIVGAGPCLLTASQAGNDTYLPAPEVQQSFTVNKANPIITFAPIPNKATSDPSFALSATSSSGQPVRFERLSGPATLSGNMVTITGAGTIELHAYELESANYKAANAYRSVVVTAAVTKCAAPSKLTVPATSTGAVFIYWTASSTPNVTYVVDRKAEGDTSWTEQVYTGTLPQANILVPAEGKYTFQVKAIRSGLADSTYATSATVCSVALGAPRNLTVPTTSTGLIFIQWTASPTAGASYIVEQNVNNTGWVQHPETSKTDLSVLVNAEGNYAFRVKAHRTGFKDSDYTDIKTCTVAIGAPRNLVVPATSYGSTFISWDASPTAGAEYLVGKSRDGGAWEWVQTGPSTYSTIIVDAPGQYRFQVKASKTGFGESAPITTSTTCNVTLGAPSNLVVPVTSTGAVFIHWKASATPGAGYVLEKKRSDSAVWESVYEGYSTNATVLIDTSGNYSFQVRATHPNFVQPSAGATSPTVCRVTVP